METKVNAPLLERAEHLRELANQLMQEANNLEKIARGKYILGDEEPLARLFELAAAYGNAPTNAKTLAHHCVAGAVRDVTQKGYLDNLTIADLRALIREYGSPIGVPYKRRAIKYKSIYHFGKTSYDFFRAAVETYL